MAEDKAELALQLWESLAARLLDKQVMTIEEVETVISRAEMAEDGLKARTSAMLRRLRRHAGVDEVDGLPY